MGKNGVFKVLLCIFKNKTNATLAKIYILGIFFFFIYKNGTLILLTLIAYCRLDSFDVLRKRSPVVLSNI